METWDLSAIFTELTCGLITEKDAKRLVFCVTVIIDSIFGPSNNDHVMILDKKNKQKKRRGIYTRNTRSFPPSVITRSFEVFLLVGLNWAVVMKNSLCFDIMA